MRRRSFLGALAALPALPVLGGHVVGHQAWERVTVPPGCEWMAEIPGFDPDEDQGLCRDANGLRWRTFAGCD